MGSTAASPGPSGTGSRGPVDALAPDLESGEVMFDDFSYNGTEALAAHGWNVRTVSGGPGDSDASWSADAVSFVPDTTVGSTVLRLQASTSGSAGTTVQSEVSTDERKYFEGTYAARVYFSDVPTSGADGDVVVQTLFTSSPLAYDNDPAYSELDFEYLPNGGWGTEDPAMYLTSWHTYHENPSWGGDRVSARAIGSLQGWHDLVMQVSGGTVVYFVDGVELFTSDGDYYPQQDMSIAINHWFADGGLISDSGTRTYEEKVDWVFHIADEILAPEDIGTLVDEYRTLAITYRNTME